MENEPAKRVYIVTKKIPDADKECDLILRNIKGFRIQCRDGTALRFAFEQGKVAGAHEPHYTVLANGNVPVENINVEELTVYVACGSGGKVAEFIVWGDW